MGIESEIFGKDYVTVHPSTKRKLQKQRAAASNRQVQMLSGLPKFTAKQLAKRARGPNITEEKKVKKQLAYMTFAHDRLQKVINGKRAILQNILQAQKEKKVGK